MKLAIVGSRGFEDEAKAESFLTQLACWPPTLIISGGAKGADTIAELIAARYNIPTQIFLPDWETHGKAAGFVRNRLIVEAADEIVAFWDGDSRGTKHSMAEAAKAGKPVHVCFYLPRPVQAKIATIEHMFDE